MLPYNPECHGPFAMYIKLIKEGRFGSIELVCVCVGACVCVCVCAPFCICVQAPRTCVYVCVCAYIYVCVISHFEINFRENC